MFTRELELRRRSARPAYQEPKPQQERKYAGVASTPAERRAEGIHDLLYGGGAGGCVGADVGLPALHRAQPLGTRTRDSGASKP